VVDDFGVKFVNKEDADHLFATLRLKYKLKVDWEGRQYLGRRIVFDNAQHTVTIDMPDYIPKVIQRFRPLLKGGAGSPGVYTPPSYGSASQQTTIDESPPLEPAHITELQGIIGCLLYYARAVDVTMLEAVNSLASLQSQPTQRVMQAADRLLAYAAAYPNNKLVYRACDMVYYIQYDASYLSRSNARSVAGGYHYLGNKDAPSYINGSIHSLSTIIAVTVASAAEAEYASAFLNAQKGEWFRTVLAEIGYPQPPTPLMGDNKCATGLANDSIKIKRSKSIDMRFHWVRDRIRQGHFAAIWRPGKHNLADFFTKPLPVHHHLALMKLLVHTPVTANSRPCIRRPDAWRRQQVFPQTARAA
jgi:hypothetical protein